MPTPPTKFIFTEKQRKHLTTLGFDNNGISALSEASEQERTKKIRQAYFKKGQQLHPDKNIDDPTATAKFQAVNTSYTALQDLKEGVDRDGQAGDEEEFLGDIEKYFRLTPINIPSSAFDLLLIENILEQFEALKENFNRDLSTEEEKVAFGLTYGPFLNLAIALEKVQKDFHIERFQSLQRQQFEESLPERLTREWRSLIIQFFAEEYLDDFQYRHALATGELFPILATRKLYSPIKLIVALLNGINLVICSSTAYYFQKILHNLVGEFRLLYNSYRCDGEHRLRLGSILWWVLKILLLLVVITELISCTTIFVLCTALSLSFIANLLAVVACPINSLIRPLAAYTGLPALALTGIVSSAALAGLYSIVAAGITLTSFIPLMRYTIFALEVYMVCATFTMIWKMYKLEPTAAYFMALWIIGSLVLSYFIPGPTINFDQVTPDTALVNGLALDLLSLLGYDISMASIIYFANKTLDDPSVAMVKEGEMLPLPEQPVSQEIKDAVLLGHKKATLSHRFFNTPKDAEYLQPKDRTFWQQAASFFGGGEKERVDNKKKSQPSHRELEFAV